MLKTIALFVAVTAAAFAEGSDKKQTQIWNLEKTYWQYVKANDLEKYRALWHENFLGWPFVSPAPVRKDRITDWITSNTSKNIHREAPTLDTERSVAPMACCGIVAFVPEW